jgi:hypothetical protein
MIFEDEPPDTETRMIRHRRKEEETEIQEWKGLMFGGHSDTRAAAGIALTATDLECDASVQVCRMDTEIKKKGRGIEGVEYETSWEGCYMSDVEHHSGIIGIAQVPTKAAAIHFNDLDNRQIEIAIVGRELGSRRSRGGERILAGVVG